MLYDGALRFVGEARGALARNDVPARGEAVSRALAVIAELQNTLDVAGGGDVGKELDRLYNYINSRLLDATAKHDAHALEEVHALLSTVRGAWAQVGAGGDTTR